MENEIKATELRVGNYVHDEDERLCVVRKISTNSFQALLINGYNTTLSFKPIPITEQRLLEFGFEKVEKYKNILDEIEFVKYSERPFHHIYIRYFGRDITVFNHSECNANEIQFISYCESIHQLQNLYHALTGQELTKKDK